MILITISVDSASKQSVRLLRYIHLQGPLQRSKKIQAKIEVLHRGSRQAVEAMQQGQETAFSGVEYAEQTKQALAEIQSAVRGITEPNRDIAMTVESQNTYAQSLDKNIHMIDTVMEASGRRVEETRQLSRSLSGISERLNILTMDFQV